MTWADAAETVLRKSQEAGEPDLHEREITRRVLDYGLKETKGKTPERTLNWALNTDPQRRFRRVGPGRYALAVSGHGRET